MPVKINIASPRRSPQLRVLLKSRFVAILLIAILVCCCVLMATFAFFYQHYSSIVDERIRRPIFNEAAQIYAAADRIGVGENSSAASVVSELRRAGYVSGSDEGGSTVGTFSYHGNSVQIKPGPASYHPGQDATLHIENGQVASLAGTQGESLPFYDLEPQLITGLSDAKNRSKRRLLTYGEIPPVVRNAIVSVEDRRFFEHDGINYFRLIEGLLTPVFSHRRMQGGSTLTMQMARSFFLSNERSARRKLAEMMIALILERRFSKEQILEIYVNQVDLGQRGSFNIRGFGEASLAYFGKNIGSVSLPEAALLAGLVNGPSYFSPFRHADRALARRNIVLRAMLENRVIDSRQFEAARATGIKLASLIGNSDQAPYYVDMVRDRLAAQYDEAELNNGAMRVYTTLDWQLQRAASEAIGVGMRQVDEAIRLQRSRQIKQRKKAISTTEMIPGPMPQVALIVLDPHTGEVLALAGGRDYSVSQLNRVVAKRPTGSVFKPFVYAAAINTALTGDPAKAYTQTTMLDASEGTFDFDGRPYAPRNFDSKDSTGEVTARYALAHSINTATIRLAEMVGYDKVAEFAKAAGLQEVKPTPAMAIGAYDATPLQVAEAYTVFANNGVRLSPQFIRSVRGNVGTFAGASGDKVNVLDGRVASVVTDMLQAVINSGTANAVRARFDAPAAGKTGTSHDAWFAGYTSNLLCVVWVGNDDYTDIKLEGARAAAPIWTEFMLRARKLRRYNDMQPFVPVAGVLSVHLDKGSNLPADETCPDDYDAYFIDGTIPAATCGHPEGPSRGLLQKMFGIGSHQELVLPAINQPNSAASPVDGSPLPTPGADPGNSGPTATQPAPQAKEKKKGFWKRLFGGREQR